VDFGESNDKAIKGLMDLSKIVSRFYLYIHEQPLKYLFMDEYYMAHIGEDKYMDHPYAHWLNVSKECGSLTKELKGSFKEKLVILSI
jgi:hypothetical protein